MKTVEADTSQRLSGRFTLARNTFIGLTGLLMLSACSVPAEPQQTSQPPLPVVDVAPVINETITEWDEFTGRLEATETVTLRPRVSGYVEHVAFEEGALVKKGDLLFEIDARPYQAEVSRLRAELKSAQSRLALATNDLERAQSLESQNAISIEQVDNRAADKDQAGAQVEATAAALESALLNLSYTKVKAPISGRVSQAVITEGNYVQAGQSELTSLVSTDKVHAYFDADEQTYLEYRSMRQAQSDSGVETSKTPVFMRLANEDSYPHLGHVDFIDNQINPQTGTIRARAVFDNTDNQFTPGLFVRVKLAASPQYEAVLINDRAVGTDLNNKYVLVLTEDNRVNYRGIQLGPKIDDMRIVRAGLNGDEKIVVNGLQRVRPGAQVQTETVSMFSDESLQHLYSQQKIIEASLQRLDPPLTAERSQPADQTETDITKPRG
ncbi:efflux RND transporter periplasmic adaptor subunit [Hahella ganghwensis]|uniref:efflux RND transporter periplasmic adaptor subunit n=1 Tax=Hahella ganghwensis TaxID=286420 RepID=UPI000367FD8B|nr:efflux RND transporter periplasmic adaptor subunit [Hahella ganghwensis]